MTLRSADRPGLPLCLLTVFTHAGMDDFIAKPLNMQELRSVLEKWLQR